MLNRQDIAPRWAALIAGVGYLLTPTPIAEFYAWPHLVILSNIDKTIENIVAHQFLFATAVICYLVSYIFDVIIAWALYYLLKPVSGPLAMLAAWFQIVYTAVGLTASLNLVPVLLLLNKPANTTLFGTAPLRAQASLLLASFHPVWGLSLIFFAIHLMLVGYLSFKSGFIPRLIGVLLIFAGVGYIIVNLNSYLFPNPDLSFVGVAMLGELVFMIWLLIWGWRIDVPLTTD